MTIEELQRLASLQYGPAKKLCDCAVCNELRTNTKKPTIENVVKVYDALSETQKLLLREMFEGKKV